MSELIKAEQFVTTLPIFSTICSNELVASNNAARALIAEVQEWADPEQRSYLFKEVFGRIAASQNRSYPCVWHASLRQKDVPFELIDCIWTAFPSLHPDDPKADQWTISVLPSAGPGLNRVMQRIADEVGVHAFWAEYARSYDPVLLKIPFYQTAMNRHVTAIAESKAIRVLDVGAGTGNVAIPLARQGCQVTLIDNCAEMLLKAQAKAVDANLSSACDFHLLTATSLDQFEHDSFDAANVLLVLFNIAEGQQAIEAIVRCVRPGGRLVFTEPLRSFDEKPLLELGKSVIEGCDDTRINSHWQVVSQAGHRLGRLIRSNSSAEAATEDRTIRAEELPETLSKLGCEVIANLDSHLGQCRHIVAVKRQM